MFAAYENPSPFVLEQLLNSGADAKAENREGKKAADLAAKNEKIRGTEIYERLKEASQQD